MIIGEEKLNLITGGTVRTPTRYEAITQATDPHSGARIRIWRSETELPVYNDAEVQIVVSKIPGHASMEEVINIVSSIPRVTKIELVDPGGNGAVVYFDEIEN